MIMVLLRGLGRDFNSFSLYLDGDFVAFSFLKKLLNELMIWASGLRSNLNESY